MSNVNKNEPRLQYYINTHHNWRWIIQETMHNILSLTYSNTATTATTAIIADVDARDNSLNSSEKDEFIELDRFSELPSQQHCKQKPNYALFRIDVLLDTTSTSYTSTTASTKTSNKPEDASNHVTNNHTHCTTTHDLFTIRCDSTSFKFLDPKDQLYRQLQALQATHLMPTTVLLPYDTSASPTIDQLVNDKSLQYPLLLKAALGSGGYGLYYVYNSIDVLTVIRNHHDYALSTEHFIDNLKAQYDKVPMWSLQQLVKAVLVRSIYSSSNNNNESGSSSSTGTISIDDISIDNAIATTKVTNGDHTCNKTEANSTTSTSTKNNNNNNVNNNNTARKSQIRVYAVECNGEFFVYKHCEVRLPRYEIELEQQLMLEFNQSNAIGYIRNSSDNMTKEEKLVMSSVPNLKANPNSTNSNSSTSTSTSDKNPISDIESIFCRNCNARPYNLQRDKRDTQRYALHEIVELRPAEEVAYQCAVDCVRTLKQVVLEEKRKDDDNAEKCVNYVSAGASAGSSHLKGSCRVSVIGIDLMVEQLELNDKTVLVSTSISTTTTNPNNNKNYKGYAAHIVEINYFPAMPNPLKHQMSVCYRQHLHQLCTSIVVLSLQQCGLLDAIQSRACVESNASTRTNTTAAFSSDTGKRRKFAGLKIHLDHFDLIG